MQNVNGNQPSYVTPPQQTCPLVQTANPQTVQVPNYSGVNIQIFNPSVGVPGGAPVYNVNAPQYQAPNSYPSQYYTNQWGNPSDNASGMPGIGGVAVNNANQNNGQADTFDNSANGTTGNNNSVNNTATSDEKKKTEKRDIVQLTDSYIMNLENYLNSQDKEIRLMGAKEVAARLEEDDSRKDDKALTALINKMLQDPYQPVKLLALAMLDSRKVSGDYYTAGILQQMQQSTAGYGQDALAASQILLKMSGQTVQKEFEVKDKPKNVIQWTQLNKGS